MHKSTSSGIGNEHNYSSRAWRRDLQLWLIPTDLLPPQQGAAIVVKLGVAARELARSIIPEEISNGGMVNRVQLDPAACTDAGLQAMFATLDDESRPAATTQLMAFQR